MLESCVVNTDRFDYDRVVLISKFNVHLDCLCKSNAHADCLLCC